MRKLYFNNKKAVSPVIATVLMIMITMIGMTLLFAFVSSYSESYKTGVGGSVLESIVVEDLWLSPQSVNYNSVVQLSVYNVGKVDAKITSIYAEGSKLAEPNGNFNLDLNVAVGKHALVSLYWDRNWASGVTYTFRVATQRGSSFDVSYVAP